MKRVPTNKNHSHLRPSFEDAIAISADPEARLDLLLTDMVMLARAAAWSSKGSKVRPDARVLFMSGYTDDAGIRHGVLAATMAFIEKPFSARGLALKVREVLDAG